MWTTLGLIKVVGSEGFDLCFPKNWYAAESDNSPTVGLISPVDQFKVFNELGWGIQTFK
jgi:hypothetical protein